MSLKEPVEALRMDFKQQESFIQFFNSMPEKPSSTVRFFNHGEYYTLHGDDAKFAETSTGQFLKFMGEESKLAYIVLKKTHFEKFVRELLLAKQYRVEVYLKTLPNRVNDWKLEYKGSPGNLSQFEDILFDNATAITFSNYVMAVKIIKGKLIAVACVNSTELKFELSEFNDNECFTELEALLAQIGPRECIIPHGDTAELVALGKLLERNSVLVAKVKRSDFTVNDDNIIQDLNRLLFFNDGQQRNATSFNEMNLKEALGCLNAVIKFLNLTGDEQNFNQFSIKTIDIHRYVRLDNAALYSLNILPKLGSANLEDHSTLLPNSSKTFTVLGILDNCVTSQGRRLLEQWIKQPLKDLNLINERLDIVECLVKDAELREMLRGEHLPRLGDLLMLSKKLSSKKATLQDCYRVYQIVSSVVPLIKALGRSGNPYVKSVLIDPIEDLRHDLQKYIDMIEELLDMDLVDRGEFLVKKSFDAELSEIYDRKLAIEDKMQKCLRQAASDLGFEKSIKLECTDQHGYFFRVTLKDEHGLRSNNKYKIIDAIKGGVRFTNDKLTELNGDYCEAKAAYEEQQKGVILEIFDVAAGYGETLRNLNINIAAVDVLVSFAHVAISARIPYVRPKLHESGMTKLIKVRHPCIEQQTHIQFIPNSCEFDRDGKILHIITGPNMCGKSTFIRSIGVCCLMAQIGSLVPCESAEISIVDAILARVGAEDCQEKGLSTFMLEMIETSTIIKTASENSLVIIDELGRGTSTYDGCGIAFAIAEYLVNEVKCFSLFATHFHEITRLADLNGKVNNLHVTAVTTDNTITPLYQLRQGACDNSYGIQCARAADFPEDVINWALAHQKELEHATGVQFIKEYEQSLKRKIIQDGDKIIKDTLIQLTSLNSQKTNDEEFVKSVEEIKTSLLKSENLFIKGLLSE